METDVSIAFLRKLKQKPKKKKKPQQLYLTEIHPSSLARIKIYRC